MQESWQIFAASAGAPYQRIAMELSFICHRAMINYYSRKNGLLGLFKEANNYGCEN